VAFAADELLLVLVMMRKLKKKFPVQVLWRHKPTLAVTKYFSPNFESSNLATRIFVCLLGKVALGKEPFAGF
jgi:hypothetical protein